MHTRYHEDFFHSFPLHRPPGMQSYRSTKKETVSEYWGGASGDDSALWFMLVTTYAFTLSLSALALGMGFHQDFL